ncbi:23S ribosomal RNA methyltransferase Erm [Nocardia sp. NBC_01329]|uniref:23S ribosomal RNA methyltransferase Erm n=1 Tax=Nocardia sp. NBC_01329 TaxID=2903594 RepID=UPI002E1556ED|nr:23S ribosomal RNA methyltransferase Erm [Nocardia sp. NBC_01329]
MSRTAPGPRTRVSATRKRLSQNFLTDPRIAHRIVRAAGIGPDDLVLEVGPGDGMLTRHLLPIAARVVAYEKDPYYARRLAVRYSGDHRIQVRNRDFRTVAAPHEPFAVVANIPFAVSTDILRWCLAAPRLTSATLLTQYEFARKHSGDYTRWTKLTVTHWPESVLTLGARIDRREFFPVPRVDGAVLHIARRPTPLVPVAARARYRRMVELGFSGVGGSLAASLRRVHSARDVDSACATAGIAKDVPVGLVPPDAWLALYRRLHEAQPAE